MPQVRCPICRRMFDSERSPTLPFCCERCRLVDLGRWVDQRYALPAEPAESDELDPPDGRETAEDG